VAFTPGSPVAPSPTPSGPDWTAGADDDLELPAKRTALTVRLERCLKCRRDHAGQVYPFYVGVTDGPCLNVLHEASAFLCDDCAAEHLGLRPRQLWQRFVLVAAVGSLLTFLSCGLGRYLALWILILTVLALVRTGRRLTYAYRRLYRWHPFAVHLVTRLAIQLCRREFVTRLRLAEDRAVFLSRPEYLKKLQARQAAGPHGRLVWVPPTPASCSAPPTGADSGRTRAGVTA
jgi:hypothetical protein